MNLKVNLASYKTQFVIGLIVNFLFLTMLILLQHYYNPNLMIFNKDPDFKSYFSPATNFLKYGYFGGYFRTLGYPIIIAFMMKFFGNFWMLAITLFQAFICAFIYPSLSVIAKGFFPQNKKIIPIFFIVNLISLTYLVKIPIVASESTYIAFFLIGFSLLIIALKKQSWLSLILSFIFIGFAAIIRPTLIIFPIINLLLLLVIAKQNNLLSVNKVKIFIILSTIIFIPICYTNSIRNYFCYKVFKPSYVLEYNLAYEANRIEFLKKNDKNNIIMQKDFSEYKTLQEKSIAMKNYAFSIYKQYPFDTIKIFISNTYSVLFSTPYIQLFHYGSLNWKDVNGSVIQKKSNWAFFVWLLAQPIYLIIYIFFLLSLIDLLIKKEYFIFFAIFLTVFLLLGPTIIGGGGFRMRLPIEWLIVLFSLNSLINYGYYFFNRR